MYYVFYWLKPMKQCWGTVNSTPKDAQQYKFSNLPVKDILNNKKIVNFNILYGGTICTRYSLVKNYKISIIFIHLLFYKYNTKQGNLLHLTASTICELCHTVSPWRR